MGNEANEPESTQRLIDPSHQTPPPQPQTQKRPHHHHHHLQERENNAPPQNPKRARNTSDPPLLPILPHEIITEILSRLPVKSLVRFRCVCKTWKTLFNSPHFIKKHFQKTTSKTQQVIISSSEKKFSVKSCSLHSIYRNTFSTAIELHYLSKHKLRHDWIVGSCNGLVCVIVDQDTVLVWNPSIRVTKELPVAGFRKKRGSFTVYGIGFDSVYDDYKVVGVFCFQGGNGNGYEKHVRVWSMRSNCWRWIEDFPFGIPLDVSGKYVDGTLNWPSVSSYDEMGSSWSIVSIDLANETYKEVLQPVYEDVGFSDRVLGTMGGCLCVQCDYCGVRADFWVMKEYGVRESWTKLISIPYLADPIPSLVQYSMPLWVSNDGEVLLEFRSVLVLYNLKDNTFKYPVIRGARACYEVDTYVESLVSPNAEN